MSKKPIAVKFALVFALALFFVAGSVAGRGVTPKPAPNPAQSPDCLTITDKQIEEEIFTSLRNVDRKNRLLKGFPHDRKKRDKILRVNITCQGKVVKLEGVVIGGKTYMQVLEIIKGIKSFECLKGLNILRYDPFTRGGCDSVTEEDCKGRCITKGDPCNDIG